MHSTLMTTTCTHKKKGKDAGFTTYAAASYRQYERLTKQMKPDVKAYKKSQEEWGEDSTESGSLAYVVT